MIMQHLDDVSTYKKLDLYIDMKIHKNLKKRLHKYINKYIKKYINKCFTEPDTTIVTFDVTSLYTSIPHEYGLKALGYFLTTFKEVMNPRFNKQFILVAADFILKNNSLTFDSMFFLQLKGTAMGTVFAPTYANLTMAYHEIQVYFVINNTYGLVAS